MRSRKFTKKRSKMSKGYSKKLFTKTAKRVAPKNVYSGPMRGGIRL